MSNLRELQESLQDHLLTNNQQIKKFVAKPLQGKGTIAERLAIYNNAYHWRLVEALQKDYAILGKYLGLDAFEQLCYDYIVAYPSRYFSVAEFGQHLPEFVLQTEPYKQQPYVSELARFIKTLDNTMTLPDAAVLSMPALAAISEDAWPDIRFKFHPTLKLLVQEWNSLAIWQAVVQDKESPAPERLTEPVYCVVWRKDWQPYYCTLNTPQAVWVMQAFQADQTFAEVCEGLTQWLPEEEVAQFAANLLLGWINDGMLSEIQL